MPCSPHPLPGEATSTPRIPTLLATVSFLPLSVSLARAQHRPPGRLGGPPPGRPPAEAPTPPKSPASQPAPAITVIKTHGEKIVGKLALAGPDQLTVKKPGKDSDSVSIPWNYIKSVSGGNGVSRAKLLEKAKLDNAAKLCTKCSGDRTVRRPTCKGAPHDPAAANDCPTSVAELLAHCTTPKCDKGLLPRPRTCLKRSESRWTPKDGKTVRTFRNNDGSTIGSPKTTSANSW